MILTAPQQHIFEQVFGFVGHTGPAIFIAGGAAVDLDKAGDIDLWIGNGWEKLAHNTVCNLPCRIFGKGGNYGGAAETKFMGQGYVPQLDKIVQVILHPWANAQTLMDTFDISTHQKAIVPTKAGGFDEVCGKQYTHQDHAPQILKWRAKTMERYVKICKRYGHAVNPNVLAHYSDKGQLPYPDPLK